MWPLERIQFLLGYNRSAKVHGTIMALAACACPNTKLIPKGETMEKLKEIMEEAGFKQELMWFILNQ